MTPTRRRVATTLALGALLFGACNTEQSPSNTTAEPVLDTTAELASASTLADPAASPSTTGSRDPSAVLQPDEEAANLLAGGLSATGSRYAFRSTVVIGDVTVTVITGTTYDGAVRASIESGNATVEYLRTADGAWTVGPEGDWIPVDGTVSVSDPLGALAEPLLVEVLERSEDQTILRAVYEGDALGLSDPSETDVIISMTGNVFVSLSYQTLLGGQRATVTTEIRDVDLIEPITSPAAAN